MRRARVSGFLASEIRRTYSLRCEYASASNCFVTRPAVSAAARSSGTSTVRSSVVGFDHDAVRPADVDVGFGALRLREADEVLAAHAGEPERDGPSD